MKLEEVLSVSAYVIVIEKEHDQEAERQGHEDPFRVQIPEVDQPVARLRGMEGFGDRNEGDVG